MLTWMRPAVFAGGLITNLDRRRNGARSVTSALSSTSASALLSTLDFTVSTGAAIAFEDGHARGAKPCCR